MESIKIGNTTIILADRDSVKIESKMSGSRSEMVYMPLEDLEEILKEIIDIGFSSHHGVVVMPKKVVPQ